MDDPIDLPPRELRRLGCAAVELIAQYLESLPQQRIMPDTSARLIRQLVEEPLPESGADAAALLETVKNVILPFSRQNGHPRFFGYVASPGTAITAIGDLLASVLNANVTSWRSAPAATEVEHVAINWVKEILGYAPGSVGLFVSGGSMANFAGLAAMRNAKAPGDVNQAGLRSGPALRIYISEEGHFSIRKAAGLLGIGRENVRFVKTNVRFRMDLADLDERVEQDLRAGYLPACVVANAGAVSTGAFDPLAEIVDFARRRNLWVHVDGAYGGFAALAYSARHFFSRIEEADSVALDPHKWLYTSMGCGCVLYRDPAQARDTFAHQADYTRVVGWERDEAFAFWDFGPELSRRFRALSVWLQIKHHGTKRLGDAIEGNMACARYMQNLVEASEDFEMMAPVELSIFCFRYAPAGFHGDLDALNERILFELQRDGNSYLSNARLRGRFALRGCVLNYRTTEQDMEILLEDLRSAARTVMGNA
jgi:glutamate/tyrosine decarboxylase-like PLP-dependent enzyme